MTAQEEVRFAFGANWQRYLPMVSEDRVQQAEESLREMLGITDLPGRSFLDVVDWVGGWPSEPAAPDAIIEHFRRAGFELGALKTCGRRHGCNEFVFRALPR